MTVLDVIQRSAEFLSKKGVESPRLQIELMLSHQLRLPRLKLYLNFDRVLTDLEVTALREMVTRRGERVPLQQILGTTSFAGFEISVGPEVLIPRPETELLAECATKWAQSILNTTELPSALDYGTGSGCLAIYLAKQCPALRLVAVDVSSAALVLASKNAMANGVADRIRFCESDGLAAVDSEARFDLVISNPPYIPTSEIDALEPEVKEHDPRLALDGGPDGLTFYRRIASDVPSVLKPTGRLFLELGDGQAERVTELLEMQNWVVESIREDYSSRPRVLVAKR